MKTLGRNLANDLYLDGAGLAMVDGKDAQYEIIESIILTQKGELQFDVDSGIDYFGTVFLHPQYIAVWAAQIRTAVERLSWVRRVKDFKYRFAPSESTLYWSMIVVNSDNEELNFFDKKTTIDGSPGIDVRWGDVANKPVGIDEVVSMVDGMVENATELAATEPPILPLNSRSTLRNAKTVVNALLFAEGSEEYADSRKVKFSLFGVPQGVIVDMEALRVVSDSQWFVDFGDGTELKFNQEDTRVDTGGGSYTHTMKKGGSVTISIRGAIKSISLAEEGVYPILRRKSGDEYSPLPYVSSITVGYNVPLELVGDDAFRGFANLTSVNWNSTTPVSFGNRAFAGCQSLRDLQWLPPSLTSFGTGCFADCKSITSIAGLPEGIESLSDGCFQGCTALLSVEGIPSTVTSIGQSAFEGCTGMREVNAIPDSVTVLGNSAFKGCTSLRTVLDMPSGISAIPVSAFQGCAALRSLYISPGVSSIVTDAFAGCSALTNVLSEATIPPSLANGVFSASSIELFVPKASLDSYEGDAKWSAASRSIRAFGVHRFHVAGIPAGTKFVGGMGRISSSSIWSLDFGDGTGEVRYENTTTGIPEHTYNSGIDANGVDIVIKGYVTEIGAISESSYPVFATEAGAEFSYLKTVDFVDSPVTVIRPYSFKGCSGLTGISGIGGVASLGSHCFDGCRSLADVSFLSTAPLTSLPDYCFSGCSAITSVPQLLSSITSLGEHCFEGCIGITSLAFISNTQVTSLPAYCFAETGITSLNGMPAAIGDTTVDGITHHGLGERCFYGCTRLESLQGMSGCTGLRSLPSYCFGGCTSLGGLSGMPAAMEVLGAGCFASSGIESLDGISSIAEVGERCFEGCTALASMLAFEDTDIIALPAYCFAECTAIKSLIGLSKIQTIGSSAFRGCTGLVTTSGLGTRLTSIGEYGFAQCTGLEYVSMVSQVMPAITATTFSGVSVDAVPLFVPDVLLTAYRSSTYWSAFQDISSRTVKVFLEDISANTVIPKDNFDVEATYSWYVDWGDGSPVEMYERTNGGIPTKPAANKTYASRGSYTITLYGDILSVGSAAVETPMLPASAKASSLEVSSSFIHSIGDYAFYSSERLASVSLSMGFDRSGDVAVGGSIGIGTFAGCSVLSNVECNSTVSAVGESAFENCTSLAASSGFAGVKTIGAKAFKGCAGLLDVSGFASVTSVGTSGFEGCTSLAEVDGMGVLETIGARAFYGCSSLKKIGGFEDSLQTIGNEAFAGCPDVETIFMAPAIPPTTDGAVLAANVFDEEVYGSAELYVSPGRAEVYRQTFAWSSFQTITTRYIAFTMNVVAGTRLAAGLTKVTADGPWAISYGDGEETYSYGEGETILPAYTFIGDGYKVVKMSGPVTSVSAVSETACPILATSALNGNTMLEKVECSRMMEVESFGDRTFAGCINLREVVNVPSVKRVGELCFTNCTSLADVSGLEGVEEVGDYAFRGCTALTNLTGMHSVRSIGEFAFSGCLGLHYIDGLGMGIESIGEYAFASCPLREVQMFAPTPPTVADTAFDGIEVGEIPLYVLQSAVSAYSNATTWMNFASIGYRSVAITLAGVPARTATVGSDGIVSSDSYWAVDWGDGSAPDGMDQTGSSEALEMPSHVFGNAGNYVVRVQGNVSMIGGAGIGNPSSSLDTVVPFLSNSTKTYVRSVVLEGDARLATVGTGAFAGCSGLDTISLSTVTTLGVQAFYGCASLPDFSGFAAVGNIGEYCFYNCTSIENISGFGTSLVYIGANAFGAADTFGTMEVEYIQMEATSAPTIDKDTFKDVTGIDGNTIGSLDTAYMGSVMVYVPRPALLAYRTAEWWQSFGGNIRCRDVSFHLAEVPNQTTLVGGTGIVESATDWTIDWGDGTKDSMLATDTAIPSHTYSWESSGSLKRNFTISITGDIRVISAASSQAWPIFATAAAQNFPYLTSVEGMQNVVTIGESTFRSCTGLTSVSGFESVTEVKSYAFANCTSLTDIGGLSGVENIRQYAFYGCTSLAALEGLGKARYLGNSAFEGCTSLTSIEGLGEDVYDGIEDAQEKHNVTSSFGANCFAGCPLSRIDSNFISPPVITATTFNGIDKQETMVYVPVNPQGATYDVVTLYKGAPYWSEFGENIVPANYAPDTVAMQLFIPSNTEQNIYLSGYIGVVENGKVTINWGDGTPKTVLTESMDARGSGYILMHTYDQVQGDRTLTLTISGGISELSGDMGMSTISSPIYRPLFCSNELESNELIKSVECPSGRPTISEACFANCIAMTSISIPVGYAVPVGVCFNCMILRDVVLIPDSIEPCDAIAEYAFAYSSISSLSFIPDTVAMLGVGCFRTCSNLTSLQGMPDSVQDIQDLCFAESGLVTLEGISEGLTNLYANLEDGGGHFRGCTALSSLYGLQNCSFLSQLPASCFRECTALSSLAYMPDSIYGIGSYCFAGCYALQSLRGISPNISIIGESCFQDCIALVDLGGVENGVPYGLRACENLTSLPDSCFWRCRAITSLEGLSRSITSIGDLCFEMTGLTSLQGIPSVTQLGVRCFSGCSALSNIVAPPAGSNIYVDGSDVLHGIVLPESIDSIGDRCFWDCGSDIYIALYYSESKPEPVVTPVGQPFNCAHLHCFVPSGSESRYQAVWSGHLDNVTTVTTTSYSSVAS